MGMGKHGTGEVMGPELMGQEGVLCTHHNSSHATLWDSSS